MHYTILLTYLLTYYRTWTHTKWAALAEVLRSPSASSSFIVFIDTSEISSIYAHSWLWHYHCDNDCAPATPSVLFTRMRSPEISILQDYYNPTLLISRNDSDSDSPHVWRTTRIGNQPPIIIVRTARRRPSPKERNLCKWFPLRRVATTAVSEQNDVPRFLPFRMRHGRLATSRNARRRRRPGGRACDGKAAASSYAAAAVEGRAKRSIGHSLTHYYVVGLYLLRAWRRYNHGTLAERDRNWNEETTHFEEEKKLKQMPWKCVAKTLTF